MEHQEGIEPSSSTWKDDILAIELLTHIMVEKERIELSTDACKATVIPFNYIPIKERRHFILPLSAKTVSGLSLVEPVGIEPTIHTVRFGFKYRQNLP